MRSLSSRERRLVMLLLVAGFFILNFLGYQALAQRRTAALGQQRTLRFDIARLKELQAAKPVVDINSRWLDSHLPAYTDINQLDNHLFNVVSNKAVAAGVELTTKNPLPTQKDAMVHRSIMQIETTAEMDSLIPFLHSLQDREDFRFISYLELTPTKDEERVRCQARIEQWWRPDSEELAGIVSSDVPTLPDVALVPPPAAKEPPVAVDGEPPPGEGPIPEPPAVEQPDPAAVQLPAADPAMPAPPQ